MRRYPYRITGSLTTIGLALAAWAGRAPEKAREYAKKAWSFAVDAKDPASLQMSESLNTRLSLFAGEVPV
jgi:hypothetical protein